MEGGRPSLQQAVMGLQDYDTLRELMERE
jgi:hypothetical protein